MMTDVSPERIEAAIEKAREHLGPRATDCGLITRNQVALAEALHGLTEMDGGDRTYSDLPALQAFVLIVEEAAS